ncbi:MAG: lipoyl(octanoyl) transferase LipB [Candidatus Omnitrophica bacterium]|nr:lipoyl(octanoyl) transferase LipB [Candidatus Omnitrophota bacterium]
MKIIAPENGNSSAPRLEARQVGQILYKPAYELQRFLHGERLSQKISDQFLLLEHPPTVTIPRRNQSENLLLSESQMSERGIEVFPTDRGGQVTLHNPGQLVGYLICRLEPGKRDLHSFLRWIEERLAKTISNYGIHGESRKGLTGLWVEDRKIASIGIAVKKWVTLHGFALNVNNDLSQFGVMHPCGLVGVQMTSMSKELGATVEWERLLDATVRAFGAEWSESPLPEEALALIESGRVSTSPESKPR